MQLVADGLLILTALTSGLYCLVLASRLKRLGSADDGIGQKIAALSAAIGETRSALSQTQGRLDEMRKEAKSSGERILRESARAKRLADELSAAAADAERTLDALYRAERQLSGAPGIAPGIAPGTEPRPVPAIALEFEAAEAPSPAPEPDEARPGAGETDAPVPDGPAPSWVGGDVLKVERVSL